MDILENIFNIYTGVCIAMICTIAVVYCYLGLSDFKYTKLLEHQRLRAQIYRLRNPAYRYPRRCASSARVDSRSE